MWCFSAVMRWNLDMRPCSEGSCWNEASNCREIVEQALAVRYRYSEARDTLFSANQLLLATILHGEDTCMGYTISCCGWKFRKLPKHSKVAGVKETRLGSGPEGEELAELKDLESCRITLSKQHMIFSMTSGRPAWTPASIPSVSFTCDASTSIDLWKCPLT